MTLAPDAPEVDAVPMPGDGPVPTQRDERDEATGRAARPLTRTGRRARAPQPARLSPARAVAGAAVSVAGVLLGIGTLLWIGDDPSTGPGPVVQAPPPAASFATAPEAEEAPVDPPPVVVPSAAAPAPPPPPVPSAAPAPRLIPVTVLNNSRYTGLADSAAARFRAAGWPVLATGNFRGKIPSTTIYYEAGQQAAAQEFARRFDGIVRVRPRFATLPARGLVVVVTRDYAGS